MCTILRVSLYSVTLRDLMRLTHMSEVEFAYSRACQCAKLPVSPASTVGYIVQYTLTSSVR